MPTTRIRLGLLCAALVCLIGDVLVAPAVVGRVERGCRAKSVGFLCIRI